QDAAVDGKGRHVSPIRNNPECENRGSREQDRREKMHDLIRPRRHDIFLDQHLDAIGQRLKKPEWPDAIWTITIMHAAKNFSFQYRDEREECEKHTENAGDIDQARDDLNEPVGRTSLRREQPFLCAKKNLVK